MRKTEPEAVHSLLERIGGSACAKRDLLAVLSLIMGSFVDRAFGVDAVQQAMAIHPINAPPAPKAPSRLNRRERSERLRRSRTMHTRATKVSDKRRTRPCRTKAS